MQTKEISKRYNTANKITLDVWYNFNNVALSFYIKSMFNKSYLQKLCKIQ